MKIINKVFICLSMAISQFAFSSTPVKLDNSFNIDEVKWVKETGNASVFGTAFLKLKDKNLKGCAGFNVELLPAAGYSNERILKIYGNNEAGQVLNEDNPPKFTPDVKEYHELLIKSNCNEKNEFHFNNVPAGEYYVIAFIMWDVKENDQAIKKGGAVMERISVKANSTNEVELQQ